MEYGYIRVSTEKQHIERQLNEMKTFGIKKNNLYIDYESGKDFNRTNYKKLIKILKENDILYVKSIDRLGRNYQMIIEEWHNITSIKKCNIVVIDMPILNTNTDNNLINKLISDIVLQILSFVAHNERDTLRLRQKEGIIQAKLRGVKFGRPKHILSPLEIDVIKSYISLKYTINECVELLNISIPTFYRYLKKYKQIM